MKNSVPSLAFPEHRVETMEESPANTRNKFEYDNPTLSSNSTISNDQKDTNNVKPLKASDNTAPAIDQLQVYFQKANSTIEITNRQVPTTSIESIGSIIDEQSPYEEVAANVPNKDDPTMPCLTFRSWLLGILFTCVLSFVNQFFWFRTTPIGIGTIVALLLSHLLGRIMAKMLPHRIFRLWRWSFTFNPGPFTVKELCIIATMAGVGGGTAYAIDVVTIQRLFYKRPLSYGIGILFVVTTQVLGYGMAGIMRRFLVWPAAMIWPANLVGCALLRALHNEKEEDEKKESGTKPRWTMSRHRFFFIAAACQFFWYWFPGYIFPVLSFFSWICMIKPDNVVLSQLTGINGLGLGSIEFDWNAWVSWLGSPIVVPYWAQINILIGFVVLAWIIAPAAYYTNLWGSKALPMVSTHLFREDGYLYDVSSVLDSNLRLNETAYQKYGEIRMTTIFAFSYGISFAAIVCVIVHTVLYHGKAIVKQFRSSLKDATDDIHAKLMSHYPEAPEWWYTILFVTAFVVAAIICHFGGLMPWYFLFPAVAIAFFFLLPIGIVAAITNQTIGLNVITEFVIGLAYPGDPLANVTFKTYGYITQSQALTLISDLKLGHYMKIPPRAMFITQLTGTIIGGVINFITANYMMGTIPNICTDQNTRWSCPSANTFYSASIIWGAIGPAKMFGKGSTYSVLLYGFLIGALLPVPAWLLMKKFPKVKWLKRVHFPIMLAATGIMPPAPPGSYPSWLLAGFFFNFILVRYAHSWWKRYAYVFSAAMDCGVTICGIVIFFALQNNDIQFPNWWGLGGITGDGCPLSHANYSGIFPSYKPM